jgi:phage-related protein
MRETAQGFRRRPRHGDQGSAGHQCLSHVYTAQLASADYVLHAFQKKSTHGITTPHKELALIRQRLGEAERLEAASRR